MAVDSKEEMQKVMGYKIKGGAAKGHETWGLTNYLQQKKLFSLDSLISTFDSQAKKSDVVAYIQSAGIFKYLYEKYGVEKMKHLWTEGFET